MFITNTNIITTKHETMAFTGTWKTCFGTPSPSGSWLIFGKSGSGKTSFALQLTKYLTHFGRAIYWSIEQGNSLSFQRAWKRNGMQECGSDIILADEGETFESIIETMMQKRGRDILVIDSLTPLRAMGFDIRNYERFRTRMRGKLLIWISHERYRTPDTKTGDYILKLADLKMRVEGFKVFTNTRAGEAMGDFVIWDKGAMEYYLDNYEIGIRN